MLNLKHRVHDIQEVKGLREKNWNEATARTSFYPGNWNGCDGRRMGIVEGEYMGHRIHKSSHRILWNVMHGSMMLSLRKFRNPGWTPVRSCCAATSCHSGTHPGSFPHRILPPVLSINPSARAHTGKPLSQWHKQRPTRKQNVRWSLQLSVTQKHRNGFPAYMWLWRK